MGISFGSFDSAMEEVNKAHSRFIDQVKTVQKAYKDWPADGEIETDLAKEKTEKDFDKKKKKWDGKLDEWSKLNTKADDALDEWKAKIQKAETALNEGYKEKYATDRAIRDVIEAIDKNNVWLTQLGFPAVKEKPDVDSFSEVQEVLKQSRSQIDGEKDSVKEWDVEFARTYIAPLSNLYRELEKAKFKGAGRKGAPKPAKRR